MKRLIIFVFALMLLSPAVGAAQELKWSEGFDPTDPDCSTYAEDCEQLIAWYTSQGAEQPSTPTPTPTVVTPSGNWQFVEDYRIQMMDAAEFVCLDRALQKDIRNGASPDNFVPELIIDRYPDEGPVFYGLQDDLGRLIAAEREAGTPVPDGMEIPDETYSLLQILEFLEEERDFVNCSIGGYTL